MMTTLRAAADTVVVGQLARDLVLVVDDVPGAGESRPVRQRREMLGGKGANQAVGLAQLGLRPALIAVAGDDEAGNRVLEQARSDGVDVSCVVRRPGTRTGLIVDVVDRDGRWRYLEDLPGPVLLGEGDIRSAAPLFSGARWASLQLQQPAAAVLTAAALAREAGCKVLLDGAPADMASREELLSLADVVRADAREAGMLAGTAISGPDDARRAAAAILDGGPALVVLAAGEAGNYFAWRGHGRGTGELLLPLTGTPVADTTGAGDALTAALIRTLDEFPDPRVAAQLAVAAAGATVGHPGGRPRLTWTRLQEQLALLDQARDAASA